MSHADVNGVSLHYEEHGSGEPLVLLHGGIGAGEMFGAIMPAALRRPAGHHGRPAGTRRHGRRRPPAAPGDHGRRRRGAHRAPRPPPGRRDGLLARRPGRAAHGDPAPASACAAWSSSRSASGATARTRRSWRTWTASRRRWPTCWRSPRSTRVYARLAPRVEDWPVLIAKTSELLKDDYDWTAEVEAARAADHARLRRRGLDPPRAHRRVLRPAGRRPARRQLGRLAARRPRAWRSCPGPRTTTSTRPPRWRPRSRASSTRTPL